MTILDLNNQEHYNVYVRVALAGGFPREPMRCADDIIRRNYGGLVFHDDNLFKGGYIIFPDEVQLSCFLLENT